MKDRREPYVGIVDDEKTRGALDELELLAEWMDRRFLDPIIGLVLPGAGGTITSLIGLYGVLVAARLKVHPVVITRMLINLAIDGFIGAIPVLGWLGDFFYQAHVKNLELLKARGSAGEPTDGDWLVVLLAAGLFLFALVLPFLVMALLVYFGLSFLGIL